MASLTRSLLLLSTAALAAALTACGGGDDAQDGSGGNAGSGTGGGAGAGAQVGSGGGGAGAGGSAGSAGGGLGGSNAGAGGVGTGGTGAGGVGTGGTGTGGVGTGGTGTGGMGTGGTGGAPKPGGYLGVPEPDWDFNPATPPSTTNTLPSSVSPGTVVSLSGTINSSFVINCAGTAGNPAFVTGSAIVTSQAEIKGQYCIVEGLDFRGKDGAVHISGHHITLRKSKVSDTDTGWGSALSNSGHHVVVFDNTIGPSGDAKLNTDVDHHCIKWAGNDSWILGNRISACQGDGIQVGDQNNAPGAINRTYIAGNDIHGNLQTGVWIKNATDTVVSSNVVYDHNDGGGSSPVCVGAQYSNSYTWFLANDLSNCGGGVKFQSSDGGDHRYTIYNLIHNTTGVGYDANNPHSNFAIGDRSNSNETRAIIFNTLLTTHSGLATAYSGQAKLTVCGNAVVTSGKQYLFETQPGVFKDNQFATSASALGLNASGEPQSGSPLIDKATCSLAPLNLFKSRYGLDITDGRPKGGAWDIGAKEAP
ncbi:MAG: right-handed parallel beta-helix repeat-containing protein [Polyangiaceae bacterium]